MAVTSTTLGRYRRGQRIGLGVNAGEPDAAPVADFWYHGLSKEASASLPKISDGMFGLSQFLDSRFIDGQWVAIVRYEVASVPSYHYFHFEIKGGNPKGAVVAIHELRRPLGRAVVTITENGAANIGYNPRLT